MFTVTVLGAGGWGAGWMGRALHDPECHIIAVADRNPAVLEKLAGRGVPKDRLFENGEAALAAGPSDAVTCTIPNPHRVPLLMRALEDGRHILADKPLVHTAHDLRALREKARDRKSVFMVAQNYRFFHGVQRMAELLREGYGPVGSMHVHFLRNVPYIDESYLRDLPGPIPLCLEMVIHHFDLMRFLLGEDPDSITAHGWRTPWSRGAGYDAMDAHLDFPSGARVAYDANWGTAYNRTDWNGDWEVVAEGGTLSYGAEDRLLRAYDREGRPELCEQGDDGDMDTGRSVDRVWAAFKDAIRRVRDGEAPQGLGFCPLEDNIRSVALALAAAESIETERTIPFAAFLRDNHLH